MTVAPSLKRTEIRFVPGSKGTVPVAVAKMPKVGVAPPLIVRVTVGLGVARHAPVAGSVSQTVRSTGKVAAVSAETVMLPALPRFTVATAKAAAPVGPEMLTIPSPVEVTARATTSGTAVDDADTSNVSSPETIGAGSLFVQSKARRISVGRNAADGVRAMTKLWAAPSGTSTGVSALPVV